MKKIILVIALLVNTLHIQSQLPVSPTLPTSESLVTDSVLTIPKRPGLAAGEVFGTNMLVWGFDRYILDAEFSHINLRTMRNNLTSGFRWDNDFFVTNLFSHPYHGSIYYNAARSNGMNYWESGFYTVAGSLMWELFMERELPSLNDLVATSFGGVGLGEVLFRFSDMVYDNRTRGSERFWREAIGFILSPARGVTRLATGEYQTHGRYSGKQYLNPEMRSKVSFGTRAVELFELFDDEAEILDQGVGLVMDLNTQYGDRWDESSEIYDYFTIQASLVLQKNQPVVGNVNLVGRLWQRQIYDSPKRELYLGVFQHFDYYDSDTLTIDKNIQNNLPPFEIGLPASVGAGLNYRWLDPKAQWTVNAQAHTNAILLGGSLSDYFRVYNRRYNWGSGFSFKFGLDIAWREKFEVDFGVDTHHIFTWLGYDPNTNLGEENVYTMNVQGDKSQVSYNIMYSRLGYNFNKHWSIHYVRYDYFRNSRYKYLPDVVSSSSDERLMVTYFF